MKKLLQTIILFWITGHSYSQLTNAEVYNFEIGDVLQTKRTSVGTPGYLYELDTIVDKVVGSGIITYTIQRHTVFIGPVSSETPSVETLVVNNLNSAANHYFYVSCLPPIDSSYTDLCGQGIDQRKSDWDTSCFEPPMWISTLQEGLGGPYYSIVDYSNMLDLNYELIYSNTAQWGPCGSYFDLAVGMEEEITEEFTVSPNPASKELLINGIGDEIETRFSIINSHGKLIRTAYLINSSIDISELEMGIYYLKLETDTSTEILKFIKV
jgi:hypothetical protein